MFAQVYGQCEAARRSSDGHLVVIWRSSGGAVSAVERQRERDARAGVDSSAVERQLLLADGELSRRLDQYDAVVLRVREVADR